MRWDPFRELDRLTEQVYNTGRTPFRGVPMDAYRRGDHFFVHLDLPGVNADSIELTAEKNVLTVKAERQGFPSCPGGTSLFASRCSRIGAIRTPAARASTSAT